MLNTNFMQCNGVCHQCTDETCDNHPTVVKASLLRFAGTMLLSTEDAIATLGKLWNSKIQQGLRIMEYIETNCYYATDYEMTEEDRRVVLYVKQVIAMIEKDTK